MTIRIQNKRIRPLIFICILSILLIMIKVLDRPGFISNNFRLIIFLLPELVLIIICILTSKYFNKFVGILIFYIVMLFGLYSIEYSLHFISHQNSKSILLESAAKKSKSQNFDFRSLKEVIASDKRKDIDTIISVSPVNWLQNNDIYPLSGMSNKYTIYCREEDQYVKYFSDRYGFRNNDAKWDQKQDFILIGDSFTQGGCVADQYNISGQLEKNGIGNINLGWGGTSIVIQSAIIKEYSDFIDSKNVVLFFYPKNDFLEFRSERKNNILLKYRNSPGFSQDLTSRQKVVDQRIEQYVSKWELATDTNTYRIYHFGELFNLVTKILRSYLTTDVESDYFDYLIDLEQFLIAKEKNLIVACIPDYLDFVNTSNNNSCSKYEENFKNIEIEYINPFFKMKDYELDALYPFGVNAHFNENGYRVFVKSILNQIKLLSIKNNL